ncbi:MAG: tRNA adenosine(34) deaminase TadA [Pseudomonadales bacterium]|jgi:tRNA(adenine34) deaminase
MSAAGLDHEHWMSLALEMADAAAAAGEVPVGAVLVGKGVEMARGSNRPIGTCDPTAHAEIVALREAGKRQRNYRFPGTTLYVTVEPCTMCAGALVHARVQMVVFGVREPKGGALVSRRCQDGKSVLDGLNHRLTVVEGVLEAECARRLTEFFGARRER